MNFKKVMRVDTTETVRAYSAIHSWERAVEIMEDLEFTIEETKLVAKLEDERRKAMHDAGVIEKMFSSSDVPAKKEEMAMVKKGENGKLIWVQEPTESNNHQYAEVSCDMMDLFELYKKAFFFQNYISAIPREELLDYESAYQNAVAFRFFVSRIMVL